MRQKHRGILWTCYLTCRASLGSIPQPPVCFQCNFGPQCIYLLQSKGSLSDLYTGRHHRPKLELQRASAQEMPDVCLLLQSGSQTARPHLAASLSEAALCFSSSSSSRSGIRTLEVITLRGRTERGTEANKHEHKPAML